MRKMISLLVWSMVVLIAVAQPPAQSGDRSDDFQNMSFEVELDKQTYHLLETVFAKFKFSNKTNAQQKTYEPDFDQETIVRVEFKGKMMEYRLPTLVVGKPMRLFPTTYGAGDTYEKEAMLGLFYKEYFPEPGKYQLQFILSGTDPTQQIASNLQEITILTPQGIDEEAYQFLEEHEKHGGWLFSWVHSYGLSSLQDFVDKYNQTPYGEVAIYKLGIAFQRAGKLDKAKSEFDKIKVSKSSHIRDIAIRAIGEIETKKALQDKLKQQKQPK